MVARSVDFLIPSLLFAWVEADLVDKVDFLERAIGIRSNGIIDVLEDMLS